MNQLKINSLKKSTNSITGIRKTKKMLHHVTLLLVTLFFLHARGNAEIKLPSVFTDNMVLQQKTSVAIWGWAGSKANVTVKTSWNKKTYDCKADKDGKWKVMIETSEAGGPYNLTVSDGTDLTLNNILLGEIWLCTGQSNMEMPMKGFLGQPIVNSNMDIVKSSNKQIRLLTVPRSSQTEPQDNFEGGWVTATPENVAEFSATGYYFGRLLQDMLQVPVGLINVSYGGSCIQAWMSKDTSVPFEDKKVPEAGDEIPVKNRTPTVLFNGMLNPVIGYTVKGCIWYQGETNYIEPDAYEELLPTMVKEWRTLWGQGDFPFYYAQIAPFDYSVFTPTEFHEKYNSAYLRDAQRKAEAKIPNSGMAVLMDIGEETSIHPMHKKPGGERLALWALADTYGMKGFGYKSPTYNGMQIDGSNVVVSFNNIDYGLTSFGKEIKGFEIAGEDKHFYPATVYLRRKSVVLSSPNVSKPVAVRYAFKDFIIGDLFGGDGLPVSSFRTDNW